MKSFNEFLSENVSKPGWTRADPVEEHPEVDYQLNAHKEGVAKVHPSIHKALKHLSNPSNFFNAMSKSKTEIYNRQKLKGVHNTSSSDTWLKSRRELHPEKVKRAESQSAQQKTGKTKLQMPIIIRAKNKKTGKTVEHSLAGNTRLSRHGDSGVPTHVINYEHD